MTQTELAETAGITRRMLSDIEGKRVTIRIDTLCRIAAALKRCPAVIDLTVPAKQVETDKVLG